jgi:hypothetical protein
MREVESIGEIGSIDALPLVETKDDLIAALGIPAEMTQNPKNELSDGEEERVTESVYEIVPDPEAENADLSDLRGVEMKKHTRNLYTANEIRNHNNNNELENDEDVLNNTDDTDLENLAELVPAIKTRTQQQLVVQKSGMQVHTNDYHGTNSAKVILDDEQQVELVNSGAGAGKIIPDHKHRALQATPQSLKTVTSNNKIDLKNHDSMIMNDSMDWNRNKKGELDLGNGYKNRMVASPISNADNSNSHNNDDRYPDSEDALEDTTQQVRTDAKITSEFMHLGSSANSISTATQTHEVRMPMYLPTFKPATGCTNASDFIVRCFVARLRSGITVVKHGRSRWCKSRLRVLHIHPDGRSLSWKPAEGEPSSSKRPPKLDLSTCLEVRHAWSPDPQNPMYTGTPILRQKCEAANAHKSFALIFKQRTVDITAVTADQCKVLMEGFSALCFRLQVANLAGRTGANNTANKKAGQHARPMPEEDGVSTTASATLTNTSIPKVR